MGDVFKEQLVKREPDAKSRAIQIGLAAGAVLISIALFIFLGMLALIPAAALAYAAYYFALRQNIEYEYIFTNGELDIDAVYNKAKRKRLFSIEVKSIEIMAHISDKVHENTFLGVQASKDFSSGLIKDNTYQFIIPLNGVRTKVIIEPNENLLSAIGAMMSPRKLFLRK